MTLFLHTPFYSKQIFYAHHHHHHHHPHKRRAFDEPEGKIESQYNLQWS